MDSDFRRRAGFMPVSGDPGGGADPPAAIGPWTGSGAGTSAEAGAPRRGDPAARVTALYREHALGLTRLALVMVRDSQAAEDIVQDAFCGLHRRGDQLRDTGKALAYVRSAVTWQLWTW